MAGQKVDCCEHEFAVNGIEKLLETCRSSGSDQVTLDKILKDLCEVLSFDAAAIYLYDQRRQKLKLVATIGEPEEPLGFLPLGEGEGLSGWVAKNKKPILLSHRPISREHSSRRFFATFLSVPLLAGNQLIGALNICCEAPGAISDEELRLFRTIGSILALTIERMSYDQTLENMSGICEDLTGKLDQERRESISIEYAAETARLAQAASSEINDTLSAITDNVHLLLPEQNATEQEAAKCLVQIQKAVSRIRTANNKLSELGWAVGKSDEVKRNQAASESAQSSA